MPVNESSFFQGLRNNVLFRTIKYFLIALCIVIPFRFFVAQPFIVSGSSMTPTFNANEYLVIDEISYRRHKPERGDVIVFRYPLDPSIYFIKRVVAIPGDIVTISQGSVHVIDPNTGAHLLAETYRSPFRNQKDTSTTTLGSDEYFTLGDNREESSDSRVWGPLQERFILGKPFLRLLPLSRMSFLPGEDNFSKNW
jgi:signal peptidase I